MYLMTCTRPDLACPLSILARYVAPWRHRPEHMAAAKRVLRYLCSTSGMGLVLGGRRPVVLTGHADASWADDQATQRSSQGNTFSLGSGSVSWQSTRSSSVLSSSYEAEIYAGAMAAEELRWLTYLLTDLGEQPRSPPVLYVDNKAMLALCREHRLEHRTKHIALRYFLARELQQRGQLRLAYVASEANTADIFTKALAPGDHQRFCTLLACFALLDWSCALSLVRNTTASKLSPCSLRCAFLGLPTDTPPWQFYHPRSRRVFSSQDVIFDESVCYYRLHPHASHTVPLAPLFLVPVPPPVDPLPQQGPSPSGVSQVDPPPLVEPLVISSDTSGSAEGGDPAADDTATTLRSPRLETPPGLPPRLSSPPLQPIAVDTGAGGGGDTRGEDTGGAGPRGAETGGAETGDEVSWVADSGDADSRGADSGCAESDGAASPSGGGAVGAPTAGPGVGQQQPPNRLETPSPQQLRERVVWQGRS
ncbi:unnamed protein product, partial [Closterium sp. NIES-53]